MRYQPVVLEGVVDCEVHARVGHDAQHRGVESAQQRARPALRHRVRQAVPDAGVRARRGHRQARLGNLQRVDHRLRDRPGHRTHREPLPHRRLCRVGAQLALEQVVAQKLGPRLWRDLEHVDAVAHPKGAPAALPVDGAQALRDADARGAARVGLQHRLEAVHWRGGGARHRARDAARHQRDGGGAAVHVLVHAAHVLPDVDGGASAPVVKQIRRHPAGRKEQEGAELLEGYPAVAVGVRLPQEFVHGGI
mmetsp:Transcript_43482/g.109013  ORF Transcript_43482/g.109013 Transcript_43482/m.109013 type:complete len:250 (+) Transcript_43482:722-1471(+)